MSFEESVRFQLVDGWTGGLYHVRNRKENRIGIRLSACFSASTWYRCRCSLCTLLRAYTPSKISPQPSFFHSFKTVLLKALNVALSRWWQTLRVTLVAARIDLHVNVRSTGGNVSKNLQQDLFLLVLLPLVARTRRPPHSRGMMRSCDSAGGVSCGA